MHIKLSIQAILHVNDDGSMCWTPCMYKQLFGRSVQHVQIESAINKALAAIEPRPLSVQQHQLEVFCLFLAGDSIALPTLLPPPSIALI